MLIHNNNYNLPHVEFISYDGNYPNLCRGVLTLKIDGVEYKFGHDYSIWNSYETDGNYPSFWGSGGHCGFDNDQNESVCQGEWYIYEEEIPKQFRKYASEIDYVFNENVEYGCCGGCI